MYAYFVVAIIVIIAYYAWLMSSSTPVVAGSAPASAVSKAVPEVVPAAAASVAAAPAPTTNIIPLKVVDPDNRGTHPGNVAMQVLMENGGIWNPLPSGKAETYKLVFTFEKPVNISTISISSGGDNTHDVKELRVYSSSSFSDSSLIKAFATKTGTADLQTFSLPRLLVNVSEISLSFVSNSQWQIWLRRVKFN